MKRPLFAAAVALVAAVWTGLAAGWYDNPPPDPPDTEQYEKVSVLETAGFWFVTGQVCRKEEDKIWLQSVIINESYPYTEKIICELKDGVSDIPMGSIPMGSRVTVSGIFAPFSGASNPGEFDTAVYYRSLGAGGRLREVRVLGQSREYWRLREGLYRLKMCIRERLYNLFPEQEATIMCALLLGEKGDTDKELKALYQRNGILHILSISSLHVTIIGMSLYRLLRRTGLPISLCALAGGTVLLLYGMMTGFGISVCRAIGMYLIRMFGEICGRTYDLLTALAVAAAVMTVANPYYLQNAGFLLSFSSVLGIGAVYPVLVSGIQPVRPGRYGENQALLLLRKSFGKVKRAALASLSITLATLPVQLWFYYEVPVWGVFINLMVLPLMKPLLIAGFVSLLPGLGTAGVFDRLILWWYERLCRLFDKMPFGVWNPGRPGIWQVAVYYGILVCVLIFKKVEKSKTAGGTEKIKTAMGKKTTSSAGSIRNKVREKSGHIGHKSAGKDLFSMDFGGGREMFFYKAIVRVTPGAALAAAVLLLAIRPPAEDRVIFLNVGQGDSCLVQTAAGENYLFDCGSSSRSKTGQYVLLPALKYYGIRRLDGVFLSHSDGDHMNGILELLELAGDNHLTIGQVLLPAIEEGVREEAFGGLLAVADAAGKSQGSSMRVAWVGSGDAWNCGEARFVCLHPQKGCRGVEGNAYSQCFYADFGSFSLLLTGDVEGAGEQALLAELKERKIESVTVLKTAHHGSRNSTPAELLDQISPQAAVISCGQNNRYGHPHKELLERLEAAGCRVFRTDMGGAVILETKGERVEMRSYKVIYH